MQPTQRESAERDPVGAERQVRAALGVAQQRRSRERGGERGGGPRSERSPQLRIEAALRQARELQQSRATDDRNPTPPRNPSRVRPRKPKSPSNGKSRPITRNARNKSRSLPQTNNKFTQTPTKVPAPFHT